MKEEIKKLEEDTEDYSKKHKKDFVKLNTQAKEPITTTRNARSKLDLLAEKIRKNSEKIAEVKGEIISKSPIS